MHVAAQTRRLSTRSLRALALGVMALLATSALPVSAAPVNVSTIRLDGADRVAVGTPTPSAIRLALVTVVSPGRLNRPLFLTHAGDGSGRLFIVEQIGRIRIVTARGTLLSTPFLDIRDRVSCCGERGLLGLAFHPSYRTNGRFYVNYTNRSGDTVVAEYRRATTNTASRTQRTVLTVDQPYSNHNGGMLAFKGSYLYVGLGDGGSGGDPGNRGQRLDTLLGKILRINPLDPDGRGPRRYSIPSTNPFVGRSGLDQIWSYGLRNPWRFSFDPANGYLYIGDVGQRNWEEIDRSSTGRGVNYGWRYTEGRHCYNPSSGCRTVGISQVKTEYSHSYGCSVTGGYVYRGSLYPELRGRYLFSDYCSGVIWSVPATSGYSVRVKHLDTAYNISSFGVDQRGELYVTDLGRGGVYRIIDR